MMRENAGVREKAVCREWDEITNRREHVVPPPKGVVLIVLDVR